MPDEAVAVHAGTCVVDDEDSFATTSEAARTAALRNVCNIVATTAVRSQGRTAYGEFRSEGKATAFWALGAAQDR